SPGTAAAFHGAADGQGRTFTVAEVLRSDGITHAIVGGYDPLSWDSSGGYHYDLSDAGRTAFIYNLTTGLKLDQVLGDSYGRGDEQTYNGQYLFPVFGGGHDLLFGGPPFYGVAGETDVLSYGPQY